VHERVLAWDGCLNVRDLGGHATENGETRYRRVVRADCVRNLSDAGWEALVAYGVRHVVDLREDVEREADPPGELPVDVVHVPVLADASDDEWAEIQEFSATAADDVEATRVVYLEFLERFRGRFAQAVHEIAKAPDGVVLIHCMGGKDRTGLVVALLLRLAGVSVEDIAADYAMSEENLRPSARIWFDEAPDEEERARRRRISVSPGRAMSAVLVELERRYGTVEEYLRAGGVSPDDLMRLRARLRD
jgi:protein-tyrosine phosphatase